MIKNGKRLVVLSHLKAPLREGRGKKKNEKPALWLFFISVWPQFHCIYFCDSAADAP